MNSRKPSIQILALLCPLFLGRIALGVNTTWTFNGDGNWTDAAKWSNGEPNGNTFNALIDDSDTAVNVTLDASRTVGSIALGANDTVKLQTTSSVNLTLTSANGFTNDGTIQLTGTSTGAAAFAVTTGALSNSATGLLNFQAGGTGSRTFTGDLTNNGTVTVDNATTFNKSSGAYTNNNQFTVNSGKTLTISGGGVFEQAGGTLNVQGTLSATGSTFKYSGGTILGTPGVNGGTLIINSGATNAASFFSDNISTLSLVSNVLSAGQVLTVRSTTSLTATTTSATGFTNNGSIILTGTTGGFTNLKLTTGTLVNSATGLVSFQPGGSQFRGFTGDLSNQGGIIQIDRDTSFGKPNGVFQQTSGTTNINKPVTLQNGSSIVLDGGVLNISEEVDNGSVTQNGGTLNSTNALFNTTNYSYLGGSIIGTPITIFGGGLTIGPAATGPAAFKIFLNNTLTLGGNKLSSGQSITIDGNGPSTVTSGNGFTNEGSIVIQNTSTEVSSSSSASTLSVGGTLINAASGQLSFKTTSRFGANQLNGNLVNHGTVLVERPANFATADSFFTNDGSFSVVSGGEFNFNQTSSFQQTAGTTLVDGLLGVTATATFTGGRLKGNGTITGPVDIVSASVEPGTSVGKLTIQKYTQRTGGSLVIELGGAGANQFDVLGVNGLATLGGTLDVRLVDGGSGLFAPSAGQTFQFLTANFGVVNQFQNLLLPTLAPNLSWNVVYGTNAVSLVVAGVPEPSAALLGLLSSAWIASFRRRQVRNYNTGRGETLKKEFGRK